MNFQRALLGFMHSDIYQDGKRCSERYNTIMEGLVILEKNLKKLKEKKREAKELFEGEANHNIPLEAMRRYYLDKPNRCPDNLTVRDLSDLFAVDNKFILKLLREKRIWGAKVEGKNISPRKCVEDFLEGTHFSTMVQFHQHLWTVMRI